jgi:NAD(P)-dependent dehydrogenase (short-subunit alcohol dehydrogenase family)
MPTPDRSHPLNTSQRPWQRPCQRPWRPLNPPLRDWRGKRVWLVGAASGIGLALADALIAAGAQVAVSARREALLQQHFAGRALVLALDVTDAAATRAAAQQLQQDWQGIDVVMALAGDYLPMSVQALDLPRAQQIVAVNLQGVLNLLAAVKDDLLTQGSGHFSIVASVAGYGGLPNSLAYGASKAGAINLAQSLWLELRAAGIGVSVINPGFVATPLTAGNTFPMPFLISTEQAVQQILRGLARGEFEIHFPKTFSRLLKLINLLPHRWYFAVVRRITGA